MELKWQMLLNKHNKPTKKFVINSLLNVWIILDFLFGNIVMDYITFGILSIIAYIDLSGILALFETDPRIWKFIEVKNTYSIILIVNLIICGWMIFPIIFLTNLLTVRILCFYYGRKYS